MCPFCPQDGGFLDDEVKNKIGGLAQLLGGHGDDQVRD